MKTLILKVSIPLGRGLGYDPQREVESVDVKINFKDGESSEGFYDLDDFTLGETVLETGP